MEELNSVLVLSNLYKELSLFSSKLRILDTLIGTPDSPSPFMWLYTDTRGYICRKDHKHTKTKTILNKFVEETQPRKEDIYGHYIYQTNFDPLSKKQLINKISSQSLNETEAIQLFPQTTGSSNTRYIIRYTQGMYTYKHCQVEEIKDKKEDIDKNKNKSKNTNKLNSHRHCTYMLEAIKEVIMAVERNLSSPSSSISHRKLKIDEISLIFAEDLSRNLWLMGSLDCKGTFTMPSIHKHKPFSTFSSYSSPRLQSTYLGMKSSLSKTRCGGDFCNFVIKSSDLKNKTEIDYDNLVMFT